MRSGGCQQGKSPAKAIVSLSIFIHLDSLIRMYSIFDYKTKLHISLNDLHNYIENLLIE